MKGQIFVLLLVAGFCKGIKIEISKSTATQGNLTSHITNETTTEEPILTTRTTTTTTTAATTAATKALPTTSSTLQTSTTMATPSTTTTATFPPSRANDSPGPVVISNNGTVMQLKCNGRACNDRLCACNLKHGLCDIDCCCDTDCTDEELKVFNCVGEPGGLDNFHYQMTLTPCNIDNGYLCILRSNFENDMIEKLKFDLDSPTLNEWPLLLLEPNEIFKEQHFYKVDDPVLLYNLEENEIVEFDIPYSLTGQYCQAEESIRHLRSRKTSCYVTLEKAQSMEAKLYQKLCTSLLLQRPNIKVPINGFLRETQLEFLSINVFRCTTEADCTIASILNSTFDVLDDVEHTSRIHVKIYHNITDLLSCDVFFIRLAQKSELVWQHFEVSFIRGNKTEEIPYNVSGASGYNQGAPVIIAHKVLLNESGEFTASNNVLSYFHPNKTEPIHIHPPRRRQDSCERSQDTVNFGESILVQCSVTLDNSTELNSEINFTSVCLELQNRSLEVLTATDILHLQDEYFISVLGYPVNEMDYWTRIIVKNYEHLPVVGMYLDKEYGFMCQNMILGLKYEFLILSETNDGNPNQPIVKRVTVDVGKRHDLQFQFDEPISIPVTFSVIFRDPREVSGVANGIQFKGTIFLIVYLLKFILGY